MYTPRYFSGSSLIILIFNRLSSLLLGQTNDDFFVFSTDEVPFSNSLIPVIDSFKSLIF